VASKNPRSFDFSTIVAAVSGAVARRRSAAVPAPVGAHRERCTHAASTVASSTRLQFPSGKHGIYFFSARVGRRTRGERGVHPALARRRGSRRRRIYFLQNG
jgi:hypothetical protein